MLNAKVDFLWYTFLPSWGSYTICLNSIFERTWWCWPGFNFMYIFKEPFMSVFRNPHGPKWNLYIQNTGVLPSNLTFCAEGSIIRRAIITYTDIFVEFKMTGIKAKRLMTLSVVVHKHVSLPWPEMLCGKWFMEEKQLITPDDRDYNTSPRRGQK